MKLKLAYVKQDYASFARLENVILQKQQKIAHLTQHVAEIRNSTFRLKPAAESASEPAIEEERDIIINRSAVSQSLKEMKPETSEGIMKPNASESNKKDLQATDQQAYQSNQLTNRLTKSAAAYTAAASQIIMKIMFIKVYTAASDERIENID